jgi:hypothetical protein
MRIRDKRTERRYFVDNVILDEFGAVLDPYGIAVYCALCRYADLQNQECYPSVGKIARVIGAGTTKVREKLRQLEALGLIATQEQYKEGGRQTSNNYILLDPPTPRVASPQRQALPPPTPSVDKQSSHEQSSENNNIGASSDAHPPPCFPQLFDTPIREIKEMKFTRSQWEEILAAEKSRDGDTRGERTRTTLMDWLDRKLNGSRHPAIQTYHDEMDRYPRRNQFDEIIGTVGTNGNLDLWRRIVRAWKMHGWNPYNVAGMLECFEDGRIPSTGGRNGNARRPSGSNGRGGTYTRDDLDAAVEEARGEIENLTEEERAIIEGKSS